MGKYSLCVKAMGNQAENVLDSNFSSVVNYEYFITLEDAVEGEYNQDTKILKYSYYSETNLPQILMVNIYKPKVQVDLAPEFETRLIVLADLPYEIAYKNGKKINVYSISLTDVKESISKITITATCQNDYILPSNILEAKFI